MTNSTIQQLRYEVIAVAEVQQRLNAGYKLHGSPVFDSKHGIVRQAVTMSEPLALQRLPAQKRRIYAMLRAGMKTAEIAKAISLQARTVTIYLSEIKQFISDN